MILRRIQQEINRIILLQSSCEQIKLLNRRNEELRKKIAEYEEAIDLLKSKTSVRKTANRESKDLGAKVAGYEQIPFLKNTMTAMRRCVESMIREATMQPARKCVEDSHHFGHLRWLQLYVNHQLQERPLPQASIDPSRLISARTPTPLQMHFSAAISLHPTQSGAPNGG